MKNFLVAGASTLALLASPSSSFAQSVTIGGNVTPNPAQSPNWTIPGDIKVGMSGSGTLNVGAGGTVTNTDGYIGYSAGSTGTATVTGAGSNWDNSGGLYVGVSGSGTLGIEAGGTVTNTNGTIGYSAGSTGTATVTGAGSNWDNSGGLYVGVSGSGTLTVEAGGMVTGPIGFIGYSAGSTGTATVTGAGSTWNNSGGLNVGASGNGTLTVEAGGMVTGPVGYIGYSAGTTGTATVTGAGSTWNNSFLLVGVLGSGTLGVEAGGTVNDTDGYIGYSAGSTGITTVTGVGSTWDNSGGLTVGSDGNGTLTITDSGMVTNTDGFIGLNAGSSGTATVTGAGSTWDNSGGLTVGASGSGTLTLADGGLVLATETQLGIGTGGSGMLRLEGGASGSGVLETGQLVRGTGAGSVAFDGGTLRLIGNQSSLFTGFTAGEVFLDASGGTIDTQGFAVASGLELSGAGGLTKQGAGTLVLTGDNSYAGGTTVLAGTLQIGAGGTTGSITGDVVNDASLVFNRSDDTAFAGSVSGSGTLAKQGAGTLVLTGDNSYAGGTTVLAGTLQIGAGGTTGSITGDVVNDASLVFNRSDDTAFAGSVSGSGTLAKQGAGTLVLTGDNSYAGGTTVLAGTLQIGAGGTTGSITGDVVNDASLVFNRSDDTAFAGSVSGSGTLAKQGAGTLVLTGDNSYAGGTTVLAGTLQIGAGGTTGSITGDVVNDASLVFNRSDDTAFAGSVSGSGTLAKQGAGTLVLTGDNSYAGGTTVLAGTLQIGAGGTTGSITGDVVNDASLVFNRSDDTAFAGSVSGSGTLAKQGAGTLVLTGDNSYAGGTTVLAGTLQIGAGGTTGSITGDVVNDASLVFNRSDDTAFAGSVSGSGTLAKQGAGTLVLTGDNSYAGGTTVLAGTLQIGAGGTTGSITGDVVNDASLVFNRSDDTAFAGSVSGSGTLAKQGAGTLVLTGDNSYAGGTTVLAGTLQIGAGGTTGSITGDVVNDASLVFNRSDDTAFAGSVSGSGTLAKQGAGTLVLTGDNSYAGGTTVLAGTLQIGAGGTTGSITGDVVNDASLVFNRSDDTAFAGSVSGSGTLAKQGAGTLVLTGDNSYAGGTTVLAGTLQIGAGGTTGSITGDVVNDASLVFNRSDDTAFAGSVSGSGTLAKQGAGTLVLTGDNSYAGGTTVLAGTLQIGAGGTTGSITGDVVNDASLVFNRSDDTAFAGSVSGSGTLAKQGAGTLVLTGDNSYAGGTTVLAGTLQIGAGGTTGSITGDVVNDASLVFNRSDDTVFAGSVSGSGTLAKQGAGTLVLTGDNSYAGGTTVLAGTLQIGAGGTTGSITGDVVNDASLVFNRSDDTAFAGSVSGSGTLAKQGAGTLVLTGDNSYAGGTTVLAGTLQIGAGGTTGSITGDVVNDASLVFNRSDDTAFAGSVSGSGTLAKQGAGTLVLTGDNSYAGGTTVLAGTLQIGAGGTTGSITGDVVNDASLVFNRSDDTVFAGSVSGSGTLAKQGAGTLVLTGDNSYAGGTTVLAGTLQIGAGGTTGSITGDVVNDASLVFNRSDDTAFAGSVSGSGTLAKQGAGTLVLTGDNSYAGGTTVLAGTLQIGAGGTTGSITGDVVNDASLVFNRSDDTAFAGSVSGSGTLAKQGAGTLVLTGDNSYAGGTTVLAGTLQIGAGGTTGSITGDVVNDASLVFNRSDDTAFAGSVSGSGTLAKQGAGTLVLTGDNSYAGGTTVLAGTLQIGAGGTTGSITGDVVNDASLVFNRSDDTAFAGSVSGSGTLAKQGAGTLVLTGDNSYAGGTTVLAGTLQIGAGGTTGSITGDVVNDASLVFNRSDDTAFAGSVSGSGTLLATGSGRLNLTGNLSGFTGTTTIAGAAAVNGRLGGRVDVASGGRLSGAGAIVDDVALAKGATVSPGNSPGTLTIRGNLTFANGSTYEVETVPGSGVSDRIVVGGTAVLNGGQVRHIGQEGTYLPAQTYTILTAGGGVTGRFEDASSQYVFLSPLLAYTANAVTLTLDRNDISFASVGVTPNQRATGSGLDALGFSNAAYTAATVLDVPNAILAFDQLSGEIHASGKTARLEDARLVRDRAADRLEAAFAEPSSGSASSGLNDGAILLGSTGISAWISGYGAWGESEGNGNAASLDRDTGGFLVGVDGLVGETLRIGLMAGYAGSSYDTAGRGSADVETRSVGIYAGTNIADIILKAGASYGFTEIETARSIAFGTFRDTPEASYDGGTAQVFGEVAWRFEVAPAMALAPFVNLAYVSLDTDGFTERGGAAVLSSGKDTADTTFSTLGLRYAAALPLGEAAVTGNAMLGWRHAFGDRTPTETLNFVAGPAFTIFGVPVAEDAAVGELGIELAIASTASLFVNYAGQFGDDLSNNGVNTRFEVKF